MKCGAAPLAGPAELSVSVFLLLTGWVGAVVCAAHATCLSIERFIFTIFYAWHLHTCFECMFCLGELLGS